MARPLPAPTQSRNGSNGYANGRTAAAAASLLHSAPAPEGRASEPETDEATELDLLREENEQLRALCTELEQALHEASLPGHAGGEDRLKEYEAMLEEKTEMIRQQHEQLQELQAVVAELECQPGSRPTNSGPAPREDDLLALSEELERDRRQIQEDEHALMQQMREMEVSMARERAEMARQRNDMQRLQSEIRHELERLERNGALQSKIEGLKNKLSDATTRRGSAPAAALAQPAQTAAPTPPAAPSRKEGLMGRLFGR
jgi:chromosome segregation ATPase